MAVEDIASIVVEAVFNMDGTSVTNSVIIACCDIDDDEDTSLFCCCGILLLLCILVDNDDGGANASVFDVANMAASTIVRDRIIFGCSNDELSCFDIPTSLLDEWRYP